MYVSWPSLVKLCPTLVQSKLVDQSRIICMHLPQPCQRRGGVYGSSWLFQRHREDRYYLLSTFPQPRQHHREARDYLVYLSTATPQSYHVNGIIDCATDYGHAADYHVVCIIIARLAPVTAMPTPPQGLFLPP